MQSIPESGSLYQLSQVFSDYGYDPVAGSKISATNSVVTGSNSRVYYSRPTPDAADNQLWDRFTFTARNNASGSYEATVTLVPPSGALVGSDFLLENQGWTIVGNKAASSSAVYEPYSRGALNHYVYGTDDKINLKGSGTADASDASLWYFVAPPSFHGNFGISYGGTFSFTVGLFSGDLSNLNSGDVCAVQLDCATCDGPVRKGISLCFSLGRLLASGYGQSSTKGDPSMVFQLPLLEDAGWTKDSQNSLKTWSAPSRCDLILVLSRLSGVSILGDYTKSYESLGLDSVQISNTKNSLPRCANTMPDASNCKCSCKETVC